MATTEHTINDALAGLLRETRSEWRDLNIVRSENTGLLKESRGQPDILINEPTATPVIIETEVIPAASVELDAIFRLGNQLQSTGRIIVSSIALRLPVRLRTKQGDLLRTELKDTDDFEMVLYSGSDSENYSRWPRSGWISGNLAYLSTFAQSALVPPEIIDKAADQLVSGVSEAAGLLEEMSNSHPGAIHKISQELCQEDSEQTRRMAATILANAFVFQENLAGGPGELANVNSIEQIRNKVGNLSKSSVLSEWRKILRVNYWPIFDIARRILERIPTAESEQLIDRLSITAGKLLQHHMMRSHDLTGAIFQRLIADRKFLAAYYTTPASAALLAGLAIRPESPPTGKSWSNAEDVKSLRIADFSCGTGTLISTAYQRISQLHELSGGDAKVIHGHMMEHALVGCDVLPAAAHLTASMLAGAHPTVKYEQSSILTVAYGKQPDGAIALGSLDLLDPQGKFDILSITAKVANSMGEAERDTWKTLPHSSFDIVIMNPPFTRATGHEGKKIGVPNPMFAAFNSSEEEQRAMSRATQRLTKGTSAHGNAGEASIFLVLADSKLKTGGFLALVMPLSLMLGQAWENSRNLLASKYKNLVLISIAGAQDDELSFSADTDMGECLVIGEKSMKRSKRATFIILNSRPEFPLVGEYAAEQIIRSITKKTLHQLEDGPVGGTPLRFGDDIIGYALDAPLPETGGWSLSRIADISLAQTAHQLAIKKKIWLPTMNRSEVVSLPITTVGKIGKIGPYHADINGKTSSGGIRGPFDIIPIKSNSVPTFPVLWSHEATSERQLIFEADSEGIPISGSTPTEQATIDQKIANIWKTASNCHFNRDFRFNSQSTGMQFTMRKTIGGRAWISIRLELEEQEKALVLWANTSLGLLLHWYYANKQQSGRGSIGKSSLSNLPILDVTELSPKQLSAAVELFDVLSVKQFLPIHQIDTDPFRKELDEKFARNVLGLDEIILKPNGPMELLRMKLSKEPSIRGQK